MALTMELIFRPNKVTERILPWGTPISWSNNDVLSTCDIVRTNAVAYMHAAVCSRHWTSLLCQLHAQFREAVRVATNQHPVRMRGKLSCSTLKVWPYKQKRRLIVRCILSYSHIIQLGTEIAVRHARIASVRFILHSAAHSVMKSIFTEYTITKHNYRTS